MRQDFINADELVQRLNKSFTEHAAILEVSAKKLATLEDGYRKLPSDYLKSLNSINDSLKKQAEAELKLAKAQQERIKAETMALNLASRQQQTTNNTRLQELQLQRQREQAFDRFERNLQRQQEAAQRAANSNSTRTQEEITNQRLLAANANRSALANSTLATAYERLSAQQSIAARRYQDIIVRGRQANQTQREYDAELRTAQREFTALNNRVLAADRAIGRYNRNVGNYPTQAVKGIRDLIAAFGVVGGVTLFAAISRDIYKTTLEIQALNFALKQITGSNEAFAASQQFLHRISEAYGIEILGLTRSYNGFLAASQNAIASGKINAEQINDIFESISKASGAMGLSVDQQQGAYLALQQMLSKGNVQAEEIRGQLAERLPGAFGILAKSMGVTEVELNKLLKDGKVMAAEVLPAFARELEKAYGVDNLKRIETMTAETTRLKNEWTNLVASFADSEGVFSKLSVGILKGLKEITGGFAFLLNTTKANQKNFEQSLYTNVYDENLKVYEDMIDVVEDLGESYDDALVSAKALAKDNIQYDNEQIERLKILRQSMGANINATKEQIDAFTGWERATPKGRGLLETLEKQRVQYDELSNSLQTYTAERDAAMKFLRTYGTPKDTDNGAGTAKKQKQDIDYLKEVYELRKQNAQNFINDERRIMDDEEQNYEKRLDAANNYYFQKEALLKIEHDEQVRLADLEYKTQREQYKQAIKDGKSTYQQLDKLDYQYIIKKQRLNEGYEHDKYELGIENAKKLKGVLEEIEDTNSVNLISRNQLSGAQEANELLGSISNASTVKQFVDLENQLNKIQADYNEGEVKKLNVELKRIQKKKDEIVMMNQIYGLNKSVSELEEREIAIKTQLNDKERERLEALKEASEQMRQATNEYLDGFTNTAFQESGFGSLANLFDETTYTVIENIDGVDTAVQKVGSSFDKLFDQAASTPEKFAVAFNAITTVAKEAFDFMTQNQDAYFDSQYTGLDRQKELALKYTADTEAARAEIEKQYEDRRREIRRKEAEAEKDNAIFNAFINTAQGVTAALAKANIGLSITIGALGLAQIAMIASRKIPEYLTGTDNHPGGLMMVNDAPGSNYREMIKEPGKAAYIPDGRNRIINAPRGTKVLTAAETMRELEATLAMNGIGFQHMLFANTLNSFRGPVPAAASAGGVTKVEMLEVMNTALGNMVVGNISVSKDGVSAYYTSSTGKTNKLNNNSGFGKALMNK